MNKHPFDELLVDYVAGSLSSAAELLVATHLTLCGTCRATVAELETIGGAMLDDLPPMDIDSAVFGQVMAHLDDRDEPVALPVVKQPVDGFEIPLPIRKVIGPDLGALAWRPNGPGVEFVDLDIDADGGVAYVTCIQPGASAGRHSHVGNQFGVVLHGSYSDEFGEFTQGDFLIFDEEAEHTPVGGPEKTCLCYTVTMQRSKKPAGPADC